MVLLFKAEHDSIAVDGVFKLIGGAGNANLARVDNGDSLCELVCFFQVVGGEQDGQAQFPIHFLNVSP